LACSLGPWEGPARLDRWRMLRAQAAPTAQLLEGCFEIRYQSAPGVREELEDLVRAEQSCCAFVTWQLIDRGGMHVVRVISPSEAPEAIAPIVAMFEVPWTEVPSA